MDPLALLLQVADAVPQAGALQLRGEQAAAKVVSGGCRILAESFTLLQSGLQTPALLERTEEIALAASEGAGEDLAFTMTGMV